MSQDYSARTLTPPSAHDLRGYDPNSAFPGRHHVDFNRSARAQTTSRTYSPMDRTRNESGPAAHTERGRYTASPEPYRSSPRAPRPTGMRHATPPPPMMSTASSRRDMFPSMDASSRPSPRSRQVSSSRIFSPDDIRRMPASYEPAPRRGSSSQTTAPRAPYTTRHISPADIGRDSRRGRSPTPAPAPIYSGRNARYEEALRRTAGPGTERRESSTWYPFSADHVGGWGVSIEIGSGGDGRRQRPAERSVRRVWID
ncbi:hypothetical protein LTR62_000097 [Meristemomyces frigidus]|uniref:Uncharacterized protein n=1 Tax=Meristemomyces frigidus TaxID=1508187 RepID=A0AAN7YNN3_9PEZI|nr:hypothetical protein LTR62_000097 [Meristemomyces frigidus]